MDTPFALNAVFVICSKHVRLSESNVINACIQNYSGVLLQKINRPYSEYDTKHIKHSFVFCSLANDAVNFISLSN